jgi:hypothetical protein
MNTNIDNGNPKRFKVTMEEEIVPRRMVLKSALAVGCGLLLPSILIGCDSKKSDSSTGAAPAGSPDTRADSAAPVAPGKVTPASVQYQTQPQGVQKCSGCAHFIAESNTCMLVEGRISPDAWCTLWAQKV